MNVIYTDPTGKVHVYADPNDAMKHYADDGFKGHVEAEKQADTPEAQARLYAKVFPYYDDEADLVTWITNPIGRVQEAASWYESATHAAELCLWAQANGSPGAKLTNYPGGVTYEGAKRAAETLNATVTPTPTPTPKTWPAQAKDLNPDSLLPRDNLPGRVTMTGEGGTVSELAAQRIARHEAALKANGISLPPPVYAPGTRVVDLGVRNFNMMRSGWEQQPTTADALREITRLITAEDREDLDVAASAIRMRDDGALIVNGEPLALEEQGLVQLARSLRIEEGLRDHMKTIGWDNQSVLLPAMGPGLTALDPDVRAFVFNKQMAKVDLDQDVKLRTRKSPVDIGPKRSAFAVTGTGYGVFDADEVAEVIAEVLETGPGGLARGPVFYDGSSTTLKAEAIWMPDSVTDLAAGDVFKVGGTFRSNDSGGGSIRGGGTAWRNRCLNLIIIGEGSVEVFRIMHRGTMDEVRKDLQRGVAKIPELFGTFLEEWGFLRETKFTGIELFGKRYTNAKDAISALVKDGHLDVQGGKDAMVEYILRGYEKEPGDTLADIVNAVTRAAHETMVSEIVRDNMERAAGRLVPVLVRQAEMAVA